MRVFHADLVGALRSAHGFRSISRGAPHAACRSIRAGFERAPIASLVDIVLSQSCLEHVFPLERDDREACSDSNAATRFLHLVDFGNHYPTGNPFDGLYEQPPADYIARRGQAINLLRGARRCDLFAQHGIAARMIAVAHDARLPIPATSIPGGASATTTRPCLPNSRWSPGRLHERRPAYHIRPRRGRGGDDAGAACRCLRARPVAARGELSAHDAFAAEMRATGDDMTVLNAGR